MSKEDESKGQEVDDETHKQMLCRYIEEKGLKNPDEFDVEDWNKWQERKYVYDMRTPEQRNKGGNKIISLQEVIDMTQEEADEIGVGEIKKFHAELEQKYKGINNDKEEQNNHLFTTPS